MIEFSDEELNEIQRRCDMASAGPWISFIEGRDHFGGSNIIKTADHNSSDIELIGASASDQDFIAHARIDLPRLVAIVRAQQEWIKTHCSPTNIKPK